MTDSKQDYLVLARKYRPQNFNELVGQQALVQTLTNAINTNKIHHAYVLTGIRGTGKTTTARIMAMALNCTNGPSAEWPDDDVAAKNIADGRHVDVLEFDAASHRKAEEIAELFEGVAYAPIEGRYKVYIIDEVHMLSKHAFNAILKTLEEPPGNVKFIFATTEVNKIPVTVLSRCQRFDLKRISAEDLAAHYRGILGKEGIKASESAVMSIARAADGSARDGLSLLDQAIALAGEEGITPGVVRGMLGQAEAERVYDFADALFSGDATKALEITSDLYGSGQDAALILTDTLALLHLLTRLKIVSDLKTSQTLTEIERTRAVAMADKLPIANISRAYQMLSHAAGEIKDAARPFEALSMAAVRLTHLAALPPVAQLLKQDLGAVSAPSVQESSDVKKPDAGALGVPPWAESGEEAEAPVASVDAVSEEVEKPALNDWKSIVAAVTAHSVSLGSTLAQQVRPVEVSPPELTLDIKNGLQDASTIQRELRVVLNEISGENWTVQVAAPRHDDGLPTETLAEEMAREKTETIDRLKTENADIQAVLNTFSGAELVDVQ